MTVVTYLEVSENGSGIIGLINGVILGRDYIFFFWPMAE